MKVAELQAMLMSIEGEMALSVLKFGKDRLFQVWFFIRGCDHRGTGVSLEEAISKAMSAGENEKKCTRCRQLKPLREFGRCPDKSDGRMSHCLICDRARKKKWYPRSTRKQLNRAARAAQAHAATNPYQRSS